MVLILMLEMVLAVVVIDGDRCDGRGGGAGDAGGGVVVVSVVVTCTVCTVLVDSL